MTNNIQPHTDLTLDDLAHRIAADGIARYDGDVARLVAQLRITGHGGPLTDLLADHAASSVARERAFGTLVGQLARGPARTAGRRLTAA